MENAKSVSVRPILKKDDRTKIKNYRQVSLLNIFSKNYEMCIHNNLTKHVDLFLSEIVSVYQRRYSSNLVLIRLTEGWKNSLDQKKIASAVLLGSESDQRIFNG